MTGKKLVPVPATEIKVGDRHGMGEVTAVRTSKSGLTVYLTIRKANGADLDLKYSAQSSPYLYR